MKVIDAQNQSIGRVASEAAKMLMGKDSADYRPNIFPDEVVHITNASKVNVTDKKLRDKIYTTYSGHPGGLKQKNLEKVIDSKGYEEVFRKAVYGMLPRNRLRNEMMKNLKVTD